MTAWDSPVLQDDDKSTLLELAFEHYGLNYPTSLGEKSIKCPVHDDSNASASVNTMTGLWTCFACQQGGDAYTLIMEREQIGYRDAATFAENLLNNSSREVHRGTDRKPSTGVSRGKRNKSGSSTYRPSWLRK
jgi:DNA primase